MATARGAEEAAAVRSPGPRRAVRPEIVLAVAALGVFMEFVDSTIVNIAFPAIHRSFHETTISTLSWILNAYSIVFAAFLVVSGRLADLFGRRRMFRLGVVIFTLASALCGLAPSPGVLIGVRAAQALGGAMVVPASMALVIQAFPVERRARATTIYGATAALAAALGPPIGGALIKLWTWRLCFYINVPVGVLVLALSARWLVESRSPGRRILPDLLGALLLAAGVGLLTLGIVRGTDWGWGSARIVAAFALCAVSLAAFAWRSSWHRAPIVEPAAVRARPFRVVNGAMLLAGAGFYGYLLCHALFLMLVWGYSALVAGLSFVPGALVAAVTAGASRPLEERGFAWLVVPGALMWAGGMAWYVEVVGDRPAFVADWLPGSVITGIGSGLVLPALGGAAIAATPGSGYAMAGALNTTARQIGGALGIAAVVVLVGGIPTPDSLRHGWVLAGALFLGVTVLGTLLGRLHAGAAGDHEDDDDARARPGGLDTARAVAAERQPASDVAEAVPEAEELVSFLRGVPMFATLTLPLLTHIAGIARVVRLGAGEYLFRRGDPAEGLYVVRSGRLEVIAASEQGMSRKEVGRGEVLGELALLAEPRRSATVMARRDSELVEISRTDFEVMTSAVPELALGVAGRLARLLQQVSPGDTAATAPLPSTIGVISAGGDAHAVALELRAALGGDTAVLERTGRDADWPRALDAAERGHDRVLLVAAEADQWRRFCATQADAVVVAGAGEPPARLPDDAGIATTVVLSERAQLRTWVRALAPRVPSFACGSSEVAALGRRWSGRSVGLVLSGGGARALAHLGVLDELHACGVNVDRIAGAGTGALIGAMAAAGWSAAEVDGACYEELVRRRPFGGYRVGRTSLIRGEPVARMLERLFGEAWIEELPLQFACTSADLVTGERVVHRSGPVAQAVLAAITTPGLMAPVAVGERLLVDAGMLDNLPVDLLDRREGPIVAVDVAPRERGPARVERSRPPSRRDRDAVALPAIGEALARAMVLGSCAAAESARRNVDYSIVPDTGGVGMLEYHQLDELRAAGRRAARAALAS